MFMHGYRHIVTKCYILNIILNICNTIERARKIFRFVVHLKLDKWSIQPLYPIPTPFTKKNAITHNFMSCNLL